MSVMRDDWSKIYQAVHELTDRSMPPEKRARLWHNETWIQVEELRLGWRGDPTNLASVVVSVEVREPPVMAPAPFEPAFPHHSIDDVVTAVAHDTPILKGWRFVTRKQLSAKAEAPPSKTWRLFQVGDVVTLKSGGPKMTVESLEPGSTGLALVQCEWFDHAWTRHNHAYPICVLNHAQDALKRDQ